MMTVYPTSMTHCAACGARNRRSRHLCLYLVRPTVALSYALCKHCGAHAHNGGLPADLLARVESTLEAEAQAYGFSRTH